MASNNNNKNRDKHLFYLNELSDYKVSSDDSDVRGWKVKDVDNRVIGEVDNLLVNKDTERVVYLDVEVDKSIIEGEHKPYRSSASEGVHEFINKEGENHIIIPIGLVKLNEDENFVYTDKVNHKTFAETKRMRKGSNVNREYEEVVLESYNRDTNYSSENNKTSGDKKITTHDRDSDQERQKKLTGDTVSGRSEHQGKDTEDSDDTRSGSNVGHKSDKGSRHGRMNDDDNHSDSKSTSFASETDGDTNLGNSKSGTGSSTSGRDRDNNEDFYKKKEFDNSNFRRKK